MARITTPRLANWWGKPTARLRGNVQIEQVVLLHKQGRTQAEIGKMLNVSHMTIGRVLRRQGIVISPIRKSLPSDARALAYLAGLFDGEGSINIFKQPGQKEDQAVLIFRS